MPSEVGDEGVLVRPISPSPLGSHWVHAEWTRITVNGEEFDATWRTINGEVLLVDASRRDVL